MRDGKSEKELNSGQDIKREERKQTIKLHQKHELKYRQKQNEPNRTPIQTKRDRK